MAVSLLDGTGNNYEAGVNAVNQLRVTDPGLEIGKGDVSGQSVRAITGEINAITTESTISAGLTGRYPFPSSAAQMSIVSSSANDTAAGTGARALLVRGLTEDVPGTRVDDSELVLMTGTDPLTTTKSFIRVNNLLVLSTGTTGWNGGTITMTNGGDTLHVMSIASNVTRTLIWSTATNLPAMVRRIDFFAGKSVNEATFRVYIKFPGVPMVRAMEFLTFEGQSSLGITVPFKLPGGGDTELTAESDVGTTAAAGSVEFTLVEE